MRTSIHPLLVATLASTGIALAAPAVAREDFYLINIVSAAGAPVDMPLGYSLHCLGHPDDCTPGGTSIVLRTDALMDDLRIVNSSVNAEIIPTMGLENAVWQVDPKHGNCHDYALTKRQHLIQLGLPPSALHLAYAKTQTGEGHAVLLVVTDQGELVLDNLAGRILPKSQTGLRFISASTANPLQWVAI
jgi:predicted transglutaminase-like cysteine proteinase